MLKICLLCCDNETSASHHILCDACLDNAGHYLETNLTIIKAIPDLIALAKTFDTACGVRISILREERAEPFAWKEDIDDQIGHWQALKRMCRRVLAQTKRRNLSL